MRPKVNTRPPRTGQMPARTGTNSDPRLWADPVELASKYLQNPVFNALSYAVTNFLANIPLISSQRRAKFSRSAAKRDKEWLTRRLLDLRASNGAGLQLSSLPQVQFDGWRERCRRDVPGSDWHRAILRAVDDSDFTDLPHISISFVTYNSARWLPGLFVSLLAQHYPLSKINLYFVDSDSTDETVRSIDSFTEAHRGEFASVTLHRQQNLGFGLGHDYAFRHSPDDYVLISNVDLRFHKSSLVRAVKVAKSDLETAASWELRQCPFEHPKYYDPITLETSWSSYACTLVRRTAYLDVGGFEERIFMYGEDVELSYRFRGAGYRLRYLPWATVTHYVDFERTELRPEQLSGSVAANVLLRMRYGDKQTASEGMCLLDDALATETNKYRYEALEKAVANVERDRHYFASTRRPKTDAVFPFNGFDYDVARLGHDFPLQSDEPLNGPMVSIVTRTHGSNVSLLKEAIVSVCNQTYSLIEHVIVEDQTDFAAELVDDLRRFYGKNIRYVKSDVKGRSSAGNTGLEQAKGALLMFLDNDDMLYADHVETLVRAMIDDPDAPAAYALAWEVPTFYDQNGRYREAAPMHIPSHAKSFSADRLKRGNFLPIQCVLFRRSVFQKYGGFDLEIDHLEDWNLWCRYSDAGNFRYVPKTTSIYRVPGDSSFKMFRERIMLAAESSVRQRNADWITSKKTPSVDKTGS